MEIPIYTTITDFDKNYNADLKYFVENYPFVENPTTDDFNQKLFEKYSRFRFEFNDLEFSFMETKGIVSVPVVLDFATALTVFRKQFGHYIFCLTARPKLCKHLYNIDLSPNITKYNVFSNLTADQYKTVLEHFVKQSSLTEPYFYCYPFQHFLKYYSTVNEDSGRLIFNVSAYREYHLGGQTVFHHIVKSFFPEKLKPMQRSNETPFNENQKLKLPYKIALLKELGVLDKIKSFKIKENKYRLISVILDNEDYSNIKKIISEQNPLKDFHEVFAKDFINSKTH